MGYMYSYKVPRPLAFPLLCSNSASVLQQIHVASEKFLEAIPRSIFGHVKLIECEMCIGTCFSRSDSHKIVHHLLGSFSKLRAKSFLKLSSDLLSVNRMHNMQL